MNNLCVVFLRVSASVFEHVLKLSFTLLQGLSLSDLAVASPWHSTTPVTLRSAASTTTTAAAFGRILTVRFLLLCIISAAPIIVRYMSEYVLIEV